MKDYKIVCLCGSTRFENDFFRYAHEFTLVGYIVLMPNVFVHSKNVRVTEDQKNKLDRLHLAKIDMSDLVFVVDIGGYIGESTKKEIEYARDCGKPILYSTDQYP